MENFKKKEINDFENIFKIRIKEFEEIYQKQDLACIKAIKFLNKIKLIIIFFWIFQIITIHIPFLSICSFIGILFINKFQKSVLQVKEEILTKHQSNINSLYDCINTCELTKDLYKGKELNEIELKNVNNLLYKIEQSKIICPNLVEEKYESYFSNNEEKKRILKR